MHGTHARLLLPLILTATLPLPTYGNGLQSALTPKGPQAEQIYNLSWVLYIGAALIFLLVMVLTVLSLYGRPAVKKVLASRGIIIGGGVVFPVVVLFALLIYSLFAMRELMADEEAAVRIQVIGERWWWRVHYLDANDQVLMKTANEIRIPAGQPVEFLLQSRDVIHSFWLPSLAGKLDMIPGKTNRLRLEASETGIYRGLCAEYCGAQHAQMAFYLVAVSPEEFRSWLEQQRQPAPPPTKSAHQRGLELFFDRNCDLCHRIQGTPAQGDLGPDLTHLGSRLSIGAGIRPNNAGTLAGWIVSNQHLKPGNLMPAFSFPSQDLTALAAYLESLK